MSSVAIVGGGASGVLAALRLLDSDAAKQGRLSVTLVESRERLGGGVAYSSDAPFHLLNVASARMGARFEDPEDFQRWMKSAHPEELRTFVPRKWYREYLEAALAAAVACTPAGVFRRVRGRGTGWIYGARGIRVRMDGCEDVIADRLVVATGYRESALPKVFRSCSSKSRLIQDVWRSEIEIDPEARVLILGNGLTAVDFLLRLARGGHRGPVLCLSRKGLRILPHLPAGYPGDEKLADFSNWTPRSARQALSDFRRAISNLESPISWPLLIDRVRPETHRIWETWPLREKSRFLRHLRTHWDVHRHRVSLDISQEWESLHSRGFFTWASGRVVHVEDRAEGVEIEIAGLRQPAETHVFDRIVNCTGVVPDLSFFEGHSLLEDRLALGIETDREGRPFDATGRVLEGVFVLGPALRTRFWEMTAIPEIRLQARAICDRILEDLWKK